MWIRGWRFFGVELLADGRVVGAPDFPYIGRSMQPLASEDPMANPPKGYHTVTPGITVSDGAMAIEFYK